MGTFNSMPDPELDYRRQLLAEARKGNAKAIEELQIEYRVRMYTAADRKKLSYESFPKNKKARRYHKGC